MVPTKSHIEELCPKLPNESAAAYSAFVDFVLLDLSLGELINKYKQSLTSPTKKYSTIRVWSSQFDWEKRRQTWRSHLSKLREEQLLKEYDSYRNKMIDNAKLLTERAEAMLKHPLVEQKVQREVTVGENKIPTEITIKPTKWNAGNATQYLETAAELMKIAVGDEAWAIEYLSKLGYTISRSDEATTTQDG